MRLLLAEDEMEMASVLILALRNHDLIVDHVATLASAQEAIRLTIYDALLLDRHLPDGDGLALVTWMRRSGKAVPAIMLTAQGDLGDRVEGLDAGADDYLAKPFAIEELMARLRAVLRRPGVIETQKLRLGVLQLDLLNREAVVHERRLELPRRELLVLEALMRRAGRTVERGTLQEEVYGMDDEIQSNALDAHVSRLRRKLDEVAAGVEIHTIRGIGYLMRRRTS
ncbi:response regulator transcription factor [Rhizobium sp. 2YAF20]|uniref:response regulator transcription factor n=1 Tax=Rhizobium sp. 2YAF20 TaxID=3233027 RepID=UPI003F960C51